MTEEKFKEDKYIIKFRVVTSESGTDVYTGGWVEGGSN